MLLCYEPLKQSLMKFLYNFWNINKSFLAIGKSLEENEWSLKIWHFLNFTSSFIIIFFNFRRFQSWWGSRRRWGARGQWASRRRWGLRRPGLFFHDILSDVRTCHPELNLTLEPENSVHTTAVSISLEKNECQTTTHFSFLSYKAGR